MIIWNGPRKWDCTAMLSQNKEEKEPLKATPSVQAATRQTDKWKCCVVSHADV